MVKGGDKGFTKTPKKKPSIAKQIIKKGIKFGTKIAFSPLTIGLAAAPQVYKLGKAKKFKFPEYRQFDKRGRKI